MTNKKQLATVLCKMILIMHIQSFINISGVILHTDVQLCMFSKEWHKIYFFYQITSQAWLSHVIVLHFTCKICFMKNWSLSFPHVNNCMKSIMTADIGFLTQFVNIVVDLSLLSHWFNIYAREETCKIYHQSN